VRYLAAVCGIVLGSTATLACRPAAPAPPPSPNTALASAQAPARLTVSYSAVTADQMVLWVAHEAGSFTKHDIEADLRLVDSTAGVASLLAGETDLAVIGGLQVASAVAGGADLVVLATLTPVYSFKFLVPNSVREKSDLIGGRVGISRLGSSTDAAARVGLRHLGIDPERDVSLVQIGNFSALETALINGAVQGAPLQPPVTVKLEKAGFYPLFDLAALKLPAAVAVVAGRRSWVAEQREVVQRFVDSLVEATLRERADRELAEAVMRRYLRMEDLEALDATYEYFVKTVHPPAPYARPEQFVDMIEQASAQSPQLRHLDIDRLIDASFVRSAEQRLLAERAR
jgi:NitT/TauT family transport system substrate-binding protein